MAWSMTLRGLTIGDGAPFHWAEPPDPFGIADARTVDTAIPGAWGAAAYGADLADARDLNVKTFTDCATEAEALAAIRDFSAAWQTATTDLHLTITAPDATYIAKGRPRRVAHDLTDVLHGVAYTTATFRMLDPRLYDASTGGAVGVLGTSTGGLSFPYAYPHAWGSITPGGSDLPNSGNTPTPEFTADLHAVTDVSSPALTLEATGEVVQFAGLTIPAGQWLRVDFEARTAYMGPDLTDLGGLIEVSGYIDRTVSTWWTGDGTLPAGPQRVELTAGGGTATVAYLWRAAWLI